MDFNYYFDNLFRVSAIDPDAYFIVTDDALLIRIDHFLNKHHKFDLRELIEDMVSKHSQGRVVYFYFYDGGNPNLSGFKEFLSYLQDQNTLTVERTVVATHQKTSIPNAVVLYSPISCFLSDTYLKLRDTPLLGCNFTKHFGCLTGRYDLYRIKLVRHMFENHLEKTTLTCHVKPETVFFLEHHKLKEHYGDDLAWMHQHLPIKLQEFKTTRMGSVNWFDAIDHGVCLYQDFFVDIVSETDHNSPDWFTEKTYKNFMLGRPFVLWSGQGALHSLRNLGFKTFDGFIDERYDFIFNNQERFQMVIHEIDRISKMSIGDLQKVHEDLQPIFEHNRNRMAELWQLMDQKPWLAFSLL